MPIELRHTLNASKARNLYTDNLKPEDAAADWQFAKQEARKLVGEALRDSNYLSDIEAALRKDGRHTLVYRQMLSPPLSQDQFKLVCPAWNKRLENSGKSFSYSNAAEVACVIRSRLDHGLVKWRLGSIPTWTEVTVPLRVVSAMMAVQKVATARRSRLALEQESAVVAMLEDDGWTKLPSKMIDIRGAVPPRSFMRKTRFATKTSPQEVDIACGMLKSVVLAMECKVTNDETNSVKRINDVLKKARAWQEHYGSFVITAALLQGVIAAKDVQRLSEAGVHVFWSHDLDEFHGWLSAQM